MAPTAIITGASQGIGKEIAFLLARHRYNLVLAARQFDRLDQVAKTAEASGASVLTIPTDVTDAEQVRSLVERAIDHFGVVDILINNAGMYISGPVEQFSLEDWHQTIDTNLWGYIHTVHAILPHFLDQGEGTIINLGSVGGKLAIPYLVPYTTSKFAVTGFTQALHDELAPKGIHVCGIYPNLIKSDFLERAIFRGKDTQDAADRQAQVEQILQTPMVEKPEDVAKAVWDTINHPKAEVIVGSANLSIAANHLLPGALQRLFRVVFKNKYS